MHHTIKPCSHLTIKDCPCSAHFCRGMAHKGMAIEARTLFQNKEIVKCITAGLLLFPYRLMLTGHSLGAGVAALLLLMLHVKERNNQRRRWVKEREVQCVGFGCPPAFAPPPDNKDVNTALSKTICFINRHNIAPFMTVDLIVHVIHTLRLVKTFVTRKMNPFNQHVIRTGNNKTPSELDRIIREPLQRDERRLQIPGRVVVWMDDGRVIRQRKFITVVCCQTCDLSNLLIRMLIWGVTDHLTHAYQLQIEEILNDLMCCQPTTFQF